MAVGSAATEALLTAEGGDILTYCIRQYLLPMAVAEQSAEGHILLEHWSSSSYSTTFQKAKDQKWQTCTCKVPQGAGSDVPRPRSGGGTTWRQCFCQSQRPAGTIRRRAFRATRKGAGSKYPTLLGFLRFGWLEFMENKLHTTNSSVPSVPWFSYRDHRDLHKRVMSPLWIGLDCLERIIHEGKQHLWGDGLL